MFGVSRFCEDARLWEPSFGFLGFGVLGVVGVLGFWGWQKAQSRAAHLAAQKFQHESGLSLATCSLERYGAMGGLAGWSGPVRRET